ncbi:hypothetical protein [Azotosporobacter soli]|uniref:hypothetical protein n=1 Tax=Azotosporobacter soli TaxID=3055040 RepID=UPI0031FE6989
MILIKKDDSGTFTNCFIGEEYQIENFKFCSCAYQKRMNRIKNDKESDFVGCQISYKRV